ncbi:hypothetical protein [Microvirga calopogonii]|uniref:hypothetical protein n=1 Tax=Microvirga calopogonii TaxID=2078013 RepID=UPI000E0D159A|nr:hypothetical protein [Microvirga calopogonii]
MPARRLHKAKEYRRQAKEAQDVAKWISLLDVKQQLLETAQYLERLAEIEEQEAQKIISTETLKP